jgi:CBS domain-containing protein
MATDVIQSVTEIPSPRMDLSTEMQIKLATTPIRDLTPSVSKELIIAKSTDSIASVFQKLSENNILSVPLLDVEKNKFTAFIDVLDILAYIVEELRLDEEVNRPSIDDWLTRNNFQAPCSVLVARSMRNPWYVISREAPVQTAINVMSMYNIHRLAVSDLQGNLFGVITQSKLVSFCARAAFDDILGPLGNKTVDNYKLGADNYPVVTIDARSTLLDAFVKIYKTEVSGIGVTNPQGELVGAISASDLKDLVGLLSGMSKRLFMTVEEFIRLKSTGSTLPRVVFLTPVTLIKDMLLKYRETRVHRMFIVRDPADTDPVGVVSLSDILMLFHLVVGA